MSLSSPPRRLLQSTTSLLPQSHFHPLLTCPHLHQRRTAMRDYLKSPFKSRSKRQKLDPSSPDFKESLEAQKEAEGRQNRNPELGDLAPGSIIDTVSPKPDEAAKKEAARPVVPRKPYNMAAVLDPLPEAQARWERKMVIRKVRSRARMCKTVKLARTERSHLSKSELIKTSIKKLFPLANQIAGKPLSEAMVQMRFSKKKAAQDVLAHLEYARDQAIVMKGMGLGKARAKQARDEEGEGGETESELKEERLLVDDKKGKTRIVTDPTAMYVDEAWVGRGTPTYGMDYRARGQGHRLTLPYSSISVVLKEEATRIRQAHDREAKRLRRKVWVPLMDRPVTAQRQYPLW